MKEHPDEPERTARKLMPNPDTDSVPDLGPKTGYDADLAKAVKELQKPETEPVNGPEFADPEQEDTEISFEAESDSLEQWAEEKAREHTREKRAGMQKEQEKRADERMKNATIEGLEPESSQPNFDRDTLYEVSQVFDPVDSEESLEMFEALTVSIYEGGRDLEEARQEIERAYGEDAGEKVDEYLETGLIDEEGRFDTTGEAVLRLGSRIGDIAHSEAPQKLNQEIHEAIEEVAGEHGYDPEDAKSRFDTYEEHPGDRGSTSHRDEAAEVFDFMSQGFQKSDAPLGLNLLMEVGEGAEDYSELNQRSNYQDEKSVQAKVSKLRSTDLVEGGNGDLELTERGEAVYSTTSELYGMAE